MGGPENVPVGLAGRRVDPFPDVEAATGCLVDDTAATAAGTEPDPLVVVLGTTGCDDGCAALVDVPRWRPPTLVFGELCLSAGPAVADGEPSDDPGPSACAIPDPVANAAPTPRLSAPIPSHPYG